MVMGFFQAIAEGILAPIRILWSPGRVFDEIKNHTRRYGVYFTSAFYLGAWIGSALIAFFLSIPAVMYHSLKHKSLLGFFGAPMTTMTYSFIVPLLAAGIDSILIIIPVLMAPERPPLHAILAVRASSLLPYTLRVPLLAYEDNLSFRSLVSASTSTIGLILLLIGFLLTTYGLKKQGVPLIYSAIGAVLPLIYKIVI